MSNESRSIEYRPSFANRSTALLRADLERYHERLRFYTHSGDVRRAKKWGEWVAEVLGELDERGEIQ